MIEVIEAVDYEHDFYFLERFLESNNTTGYG
jgi:hypothetical protein